MPGEDALAREADARGGGRTSAASGAAAFGFRAFWLGERGEGGKGGSEQEHNCVPSVPRYTEKTGGTGFLAPHDTLHHGFLLAYKTKSKQPLGFFIIVFYREMFTGRRVPRKMEMVHLHLTNRT